MISFILSVSIILLICVFLILGGIVMMYSKSSPRDIRFWWRILMVISGIIIGAEAIIAYINKDTFFKFEEIPLSLRLINEWFIIAQLVSMIVVAGLRSKLSRTQTILFPSLIILSVVISLCYYDFSGVFTPLHNWKDIFSNFDKTDVRLRFILFILSILSTAYMIYIPLAKEIITKKIAPSKWLWTYLFFAFLQPITYILYSMGSPVSGIILAIGCLSFITIFTFAFLRNENPLIRAEDVPAFDYIISKKKNDDTVVTPVKVSISNLSKFISNNNIYLNKTLSLDDLSMMTMIQKSDIISYYKKIGYSNFSDFISSFRLECFKRKIKNNPRVPIAVIATDSGFPSRTGFYRYFQIEEKMSPSEYKAKLKS